MLRLVKRIYYHTDGRIALALACIAACTAVIYVSTWGRTPHFFQETYGPAVMLATGHGFISPDLAQLPELDTFLHPVMHVGQSQLQDQFDSSTLPDEIPQGQWDLIGAQSMGLLYAAGLCWLLMGVVAWSALAPLYGLLYAISAAALYGIFRQIAGRSLAFAATLLMILSPVQLNNLVRLRDYGKAPFIFLGMLLLLWLLRRPCSRGKALTLSLLMGLVVGIGSTFRMDVLILLPAFVITLVFFLPTRWYRIWPTRILSLVLCLGACSFTLAPVPSGLENASNVGNYVTLGHSPLYDQRLGVSAPTYQLLHRSMDYEALAHIQQFRWWQGNDDEFLAFSTPEFTIAGDAFIKEHIRTFPADYVLRSEMAILRTLDELGSNPDMPAPRGITHPFLLTCYDIHAFIMHWLTRYARYFVPFTLIILSCFSLRQAFAGFFFVCYFTSYSGAIQFASRHYFQYEIFALFIALFILVWLVYGLRLAINRDHWTHWSRYILPRTLWLRAEWKRALFFVVVTTLCLTLPLFVLREYQTPRVQTLLSAYSDADTQRLKVDVHHSLTGDTLLIHPEFNYKTFKESASVTPSFETHLLMVEVDTTQAPVEIGIRYGGSQQDLAFDWELQLPQTKEGNTRAYFPVYQARWAGSDDWTCFKGLRIDRQLRPALKGIYRVRTPEAMGLPMTIILPGDWVARPPYQKRFR